MSRRHWKPKIYHYELTFRAAYPVHMLAEALMRHPALRKKLVSVYSLPHNAQATTYHYRIGLLNGRLSRKTLDKVLDEVCAPG